MSTVTINKQDGRRKDRQDLPASLIYGLQLGFIGSLMDFIMALWHKREAQRKQSIVAVGGVKKEREIAEKLLSILR